MPRRNPHEQQHTLFAIDGGQKDPSPGLSLVGDHASAEPANSGDRSPESPKRAQIRATGRPQTARFGRPVARISNEEEWPSRQARARRGGRFNPVLIEKVDKLLNDQKKLWQDFVDAAMQVWLDEGAPDLGVWATACSSSSCSGGIHSSNCGKNKTTTTTTTAVARTLPGLPTELLEMPHKTRHALQTLWEYAQSSYRSEYPEFAGVNRPAFWIKKAWREGAYDSMVDAWLEHKRLIAAAADERERLRKQKESEQRLERDQILADREERQRTGEKPWQARKE